MRASGAASFARQPKEEASMSSLQHLFALVGRLALSAVFLWSGAQGILGWGDYRETIAEKLPALQQAWVDANGEVVSLAVAIAAIVMLLGGGLSLALGLWARFGAFLLILFLVVATAMFHDFWSYDPTETIYREMAVQFLKNVALLGGLLMVVAFGGGKIGADGLFRREAT
jgi:putative oxidoreductase